MKHIDLFNPVSLIGTDRGREFDYHGCTPSVDEVWQLLDLVPDPEIPVISVVDLGIVRDVRLNNDSWQVDITPTYSGCPATDFIASEIEQALTRAGIDAKIKTVLAPAWSSTWISTKGRQAMLASNIVPPLHDLDTLSCPNCGSAQVKQQNQFGSTACKALYTCQSCLEPFDYFKTI
ncbi:MAG: phenylacetate-CoA oxygenase subunit PaaJ [Gammaproteobacteria bacterium]|jgi:ring-1,2-phenylacetyl-CoA epoxidase subunit PaaD|nr:phenylacetate-CoA oxygenase subunit PaaJ [Gammaproteobacteria bacterium]MCP4881615.1 phenylacetate-CoA oxygenase subunit PaaJ [Gammaproteobacteria bacterium]MDP6166168.1 phenylacetate-CoA oxygenase subunit PaaJ [Gammaproteobacteria bacterium]